MHLVRARVILARQLEHFYWGGRNQIAFTTELRCNQQFLVLKKLVITVCIYRSIQAQSWIKGAATIKSKIISIFSNIRIRYYLPPSDTFLKAIYYFAQAGSNFEPVYIFEVIYGLQRARILLSKVIYGLKNGPKSEVIYSR